MNLSETVHHPTTRRNCTGCGARVFTFATGTDEVGNEVGWACTMCADRLRGVPLCAACRRPIVAAEDCGMGRGTQSWVHRDATVFAIRHTAAPEPLSYREATIGAFQWASMGRRI